MYEEMMQYVKETLTGTNLNASSLKTQYPFRNRFEHCLRVYHWALRIHAKEGGDGEIIAIAAIFHDIGKASAEDRPHAEISAELCAEYLQKINYPADKLARVVQAVRNHSYKKEVPGITLALEDKILIDADLLDEVGALGAIWDSMAVALKNEPSYLKAYQRSQKYYEKLQDEAHYFKTEQGLRLFHERLKFLEVYLQNVGFELGLHNLA